MAQDGERSVSVKWIVAGVLVVVLAWFCLANSARVKVDFIVTTRDVRLIWVILISAVLGAAIAALVSWRHRA
jgi:uncharacterized integral membrane protein